MQKPPLAVARCTRTESGKEEREGTDGKKRCAETSADMLGAREGKVGRWQGIISEKVFINVLE